MTKLTKEQTDELEKHLTALQAAQQFCEDIRQEIEEHISEQSEKWQESDKGVAYNDWMETWEALGDKVNDLTAELDNAPKEPG